jgi:hypothetical protein
MAIPAGFEAVTHGVDRCRIPYRHLRAFKRSLNRKDQRCGLTVRSFIVGAGSAQNNRRASKGRYSRTLGLTRCDHYDR